MSAATENASSPTPSPRPPAKKRRWLKITLISLAVLVLLVLLLPTLISWFGKGMILGQVNKRIMGRVNAESISVGWFTGAKLTGVKAYAPDNSLVVSVPSVSTGLTVLGALGASMDLGEIRLVLEKYADRVGEDGSLKIAQAFAPRDPTPSDPNKPSTPMSFHLIADIQSAQVEQANGPTIAMSGGKVDLTYDSTGKRPFLFTHTSELRVGDGPAKQLSAKANLTLFKDGRIRDFGEIVGDASWDAGDMDAAVVGPLFKKLGFTIKPGGTVRIKGSYNAPGPGNGVLDAPFVLNGTAVTDRGEEVPLQNTALTFRGNLEGNAIKFVEGSGLQSDMLVLTVQGSISKENIDIRGEIEPRVERITQLVSAKLPEDTKATGRHRTKYHIYGPPTLTGLTVDPQSNTTFGLDRVSIPSQGIDASGFIGISMQKGKVYVTTNNATANSGKLQVVGYIDLAAEKPAFVVPQRTEVVINAQINKPLGDKLLVWLPTSWGLGENATARVTGQISLTLDEAYIPTNWEEFLKHGKLKGRVTIRDFSTESPLLSEMTKLLGPFAQIAPMDLSWRAGNIPPVEFDIHDGRAYYRDLTIALPAMTVTFSGDVGLDFKADTGAPLNMTVGLKHKNFPAPVVFALKGTTKKYQLVLDEKTVQKTLENVAPKLIDDVLKKKGFQIPH